jgi:hypothetical protein
MAITLNGLVLDNLLSAVREQHEEVGGRDVRTVELSGLILGEASIDAIEARLDAVLDAASTVDYSAPLSVRSGRRLMVRRAAFQREIERNTLVGSFRLRLEAREPFEESEDPTEVSWSISGAPSILTLTSSGTVSALPVIALTVEGTLVEPAVSDGERSIEYDGVVNSGAELVFDAVQAKVLVDGEDVTPYALGEFPRIGPGETTLTYTAAPESVHLAAGTVAYRDRWW